jgi:hypothetical protein
MPLGNRRQHCETTMLAGVQTRTNSNCHARHHYSGDAGVYGRVEMRSVLTKWIWVYLPDSAGSGHGYRPQLLTSHRYKHRHILHTQNKNSARRSSDTTLSQISPLYTVISYFFTIHCTYAYQFKILFPSSFSTKILCALLISPIREP